jgi:FkbM family methyltransferase
MYRLRYHFFSFLILVWGFSKIGLSGALKIFLARYLPGEWKIKPRGYPAPIILRGKTSDTKLFFDILIYQEYPVPNPYPEFVVDAGANIGLFSVYYAVHCPDSRIIAIEPEDSNFEILVRNTSAYPNVTRIKKGLWGETCKLRILDKFSEKWSFTLIPDSEGDIPAICMNEIFDQIENLGQNILVKMDIEGADQYVLENNLEWLSRVSNLYIEIHGSWRQLFKALEPYDYDVRQRRENYLIAINPRKNISCI